MTDRAWTIREEIDSGAVSERLDEFYEGYTPQLRAEKEKRELKMAVQALEKADGPLSVRSIREEVKRRTPRFPGAPSTWTTTGDWSAGSMVCERLGKLPGVRPVEEAME